MISPNEEISMVRRMLLDMQKVVEKTSETIQTMYEVLHDLSDRVEVLEEKK